MIAVGSVVIHIFAVGRAGKVGSGVDLLAVGTVDFYLIKRGTLGFIVADIVNIIPVEGSVKARRRIQNQNGVIAAFPVNAAETVGVDREKGESGARCSRIVAHIVEIMFVRIDVGYRVITELCQIASVRRHRIQLPAVGWVGKIYRAVVFAEETAVVEVASGVAIHVTLIKMSPVGEIVENDSRCDKCDNDDDSNDNGNLFFHGMIPSFV